MQALILNSTASRADASATLCRMRRIALALILFFAGCQLSTAQESDHTAINTLLDDFHRAAAEADEQRYLGHFAPGGVFMGTDDWERWPLPEFREYVKQRFAGGSGWTYVPEDRVLTLAEQGDIAWFDEVAVSERWGRFRGTGVLVMHEGEWKIAHYSLTALVPNERFADVAKITTEGFEARGDQGKPE